MFNLSGERRKYLIIALAVVVIALAGLLIYFQYSKLMDLRAEVEEEEIALEAARATLERRFEYQQRADEYEERLDYALAKMPTRAEEEGVLRYIHHLAGEYDLRPVEITFEEHYQAEEGYMNMPLSITIEGSYNGIRRLFNDLYSGDRAVRIDNFDVTRAGGNGLDLQVNISAYTFYNP